MVWLSLTTTPVFQTPANEVVVYVASVAVPKDEPSRNNSNKLADVLVTLTVCDDKLAK